MQKVYRIEGLHCSNCVAKVEKALSAKGVPAKVTLDPPRVRVTGAASEAEIAAVVAAAGDFKIAGEAVGEAKTGAGLIDKLRGVFSGR